MFNDQGSHRRSRRSNDVKWRYWRVKLHHKLNAQSVTGRDEKIVEGCSLYAKALERAKNGERTVSLDEITAIQALERKYPDLPMQMGHVQQREFEYKRHGTLSCIINLDVPTGTVILPSCGPTRNKEDLVLHIQRLIE